jgi:RND family efflux transporter MFP subunit
VASTLVASALLGTGYLASRGLGLAPGQAAVDKPLSVAARRAELRVIVTESGSLQSVETVDGVCEVQSPTGQVKIIQLVPEGTKVKKGDVVCRFDSADIQKNIAQQEIKVKQAFSKSETTAQELEIAKSKAASDVKKAKLDLDLALLDKQKYEESDYAIELKDIQSIISQNEGALEKQKSVYDQTKELVRKGFRTPQQLREAELLYQQQVFAVDRDKQKQAAKEAFEKKRKDLELRSKVEQSQEELKRQEATAKASIAKAESELVAARSTHELEERQLTEYQSQLAKCEVKATQDGVVAYANDRWYGDGQGIREGASVYNRQKIFSLPDMSRMQVKVNIHESMIKKVKEGQTAEIRVDAFPNLVLVGKVKSVSQLSDSNQMWMSGGAKEYTTVVTIEKMPDEELRPGMTAEVRIRVNLLKDVLVVPLQAVAERKGKRYAYVEGPGGTVERREIQVGDNNEKLVQVTGGLEDGERVLLDARLRSEEEFKAEDASGEDEGAAAAGAEAAPEAATAVPAATLEVPAAPAEAAPAAVEAAPAAAEAAPVAAPPGS